MRAVFPTGDGHEVELVKLPDPIPAAGQIRIRVAGAAVHAADLHIIDGAHGAAGRRMGLGLDLAGVVDMVGSGVQEFAVGTPVAAIHLPGAPHAVAGSAADYVIVPATDAAPIPDGLALLDAATVPLNALTAAQLLALLGPSEARRLLVTGAAGGVGGYLVTLATRAGWQVTALVRGPDDGFCTRAGATEVVSDLDDLFGFDAVVDTALLGRAALPPLRDGGTFVSAIPALAPKPERNITVTASAVTPDGPLLREMLDLAARGVLEPRIAGILPLADAARAYRAFRTGAQRGRWILTT